MHGIRKVAILGYHKIGEPPADWWSWFYVPETVFARQMQTVRESGWEVIDDAAFLHGLDEPSALPERAVLLTFDDASLSVHGIAWPILQELHMPGVLFVPTSFVGRTNEWDSDIEPPDPICGWEELRELESTGLSIQSHTVSHRRLSDLETNVQREEFCRSKTVLEQELGKSIELVAYPYGDPGSSGRLACEIGYRAGFLYGGGAVTLPPEDRFLIERVPVGSETDLSATLGH